MRRIGVFICHCGVNIAGTVDVAKVAEALRSYPGVVGAVDYKYMCSEPGQNLIKQAIVEHQLDGVVVAACSPAMHEMTFRKAVTAQGLNFYQCEMANIREQCSWVHQQDREEATEKAIEIIQSMVEKVRRDEALEWFKLPLVKRAMVIGGGIAGLQAALDIADAGYEVVLVERSNALGGKMAQLSGTYINFDSANDSLQLRLQQVREHPHIRVLTNSEVSAVSGYVGNFQVSVSPAGQVSHADAHCSLLPAPCYFDIGAIVVATGYQLMPKEQLGEYGAGQYPNVVDGLQVEAMLRPDGPTGGKILRPSDGKPPKEVVWVQCAGSRDSEHGVPYCSKVCCMYVAKQATLFKQQVPDGQAYVFYIDIRSGGKGYEEFVQSAMEEHGVLYLRGKVSKVFEEGDKVIVWGVDTLTGKHIEIYADLVVLAMAVVPSAGAKELAQTLRVATDEHGFFSEAHPKLRPVESLTAGIYLAGATQAPKDIPEAIAQASGAAAKVLSLFSHKEMTQEPLVAYVVDELCAGCGSCVEACPYEARGLNALTNVAEVNPALCQGCGACVIACPNKASKLRNSTPEQVLAMIDALL